MLLLQQGVMEDAVQKLEEKLHSQSYFKCFDVKVWKDTVDCSESLMLTLNNNDRIE